MNKLTPRQYKNEIRTLTGWLAAKSPENSRVNWRVLQGTVCISMFVCSLLTFLRNVRPLGECWLCKQKKQKQKQTNHHICAKIYAQGRNGLIRNANSIYIFCRKKHKWFHMWLKEPTVKAFCRHFLKIILRIFALDLVYRQINYYVLCNLWVVRSWTILTLLSQNLQIIGTYCFTVDIRIVKQNLNIILSRERV